jgi:murein L,D-transpeptidase YcbB/YkuD
MARGMIMEKKKVVSGDLYQRICFLTVPAFILKDIIDNSQVTHLQAIVKD